MRATARCYKMYDIHLVNDKSKFIYEVFMLFCCQLFDCFCGGVIVNQHVAEFYCFPMLRCDMWWVVQGLRREAESGFASMQYSQVLQIVFDIF